MSINTPENFQNRGQRISRGRTLAKKASSLWSKLQGTPQTKNLRLIKERHEAIIQTKSIDSLKTQLGIEAFSKKERKELKKKPKNKK